MRAIRIFAFLLLSVMLAGIYSPAIADVAENVEESFYSADSFLQAFTNDDVRKQLKKKYEFDYKPYLKGEKKLGFKPDKDLYQRIYYMISLKYVQPVNNQEMNQGVIKEVTRLLNQARVDTADMAKIPRAGVPMEEVVAVYGKRVNPDLLRYACIRGMIDSLNDPHTVLMLPSEYQRLKESMAGGNFSGIGVFIMKDMDNYGWLTISEPIEGTPAYLAKLQPGDVIYAVNGESTKDEPIDLTISKIRGPEGSKVLLTIKRKGVDKPFNVSLTRKFIHVSSVKSEMLPGKIGYVKLRLYGDDSGKEMDLALDKLKSQGAKALIFDVRNNSGGLIDIAQDVCSKFLPSGSPVVSVVNRAKSKRIMRSTGGKYTSVPMVLLINELSASASEITAGALKDHKRAKLIGARTFGKGSVQELSPVPGTSSQQAALKLTVALFYTPKGFKINGQGLQPDIMVPMELKDASSGNPAKDIQLKKAIEYLKTRIN